MAEPEIRTYYPGLIGGLTELHGRYYAEHWSLDVTFEAQVARESARFALRLDPKRDGLWAACGQNGLAGAIAVDGADAAGQGARLRWFIVAPDLQGSGLGRRLINHALDFCRVAGHRRVFLWTYAGLDRARSLYESCGFRLVEEKPGRIWGRELTEQKFVLDLDAA